MPYQSGSRRRFRGRARSQIAPAWAPAAGLRRPDTTPIAACPSSSNRFAAGFGHSVIVRSLLKDAKRGSSSWASSSRYNTDSGMSPFVKVALRCMLVSLRRSIMHRWLQMFPEALAALLATCLAFWNMLPAAFWKALPSAGTRKR